MGEQESRADRSRRRRSQSRARVRQLDQRLERLKLLLARLRAGSAVTDEDLAEADGAALASRRAADTAEANSRQAHHDAATAHRNAAERLDRAGRAQRADEQRRLAAEDDREGDSTG